MGNKAVRLTQAIIDKDNDTITSMLSDQSANTWISSKVPTVSLTNHELNDHVTTTSALDRACYLSSLSNVRALVDAGAELYNINSIGLGALHAACGSEIERVQKVKYLIQCDSDIIHSKNGNNTTTAHMAAMYGHTDALQCVLECNDTLKEEMNIYGNLPIHEAALKGHPECVEILHKRHQDINIIGGKYNSTCLHLAAQEGRVHCIDPLVRLGADPQLRDKFGRSALHRAAVNGHTQCIDILVNKCGIDINAGDKDHETALYTAAKEGYLTFVRKLLSYDKCDVLTGNHEGKTAHMIARDNNHQRVAELLKDYETTHELKEKLRIKREHSALRRELMSSSGASSEETSSGPNDTCANDTVTVK